MEIRELDRADIDSSEFWHLLWFSCELEDLELRRVRDIHLPQLSVVGASDDGTVVGFVAYEHTGSRLTIEYIATAERRRGTGLGTALIGELQRRHPGVILLAQTDDDAIGFYRARGFTDTPAPRDSRWPHRERYDCVLRPHR